MKFVKYIDDVYEKHLGDELKKLTRRDAHIDVVENATIVVNTKTHAYGIFDENKKVVKSGLQYRGKNHQFIPSFVSGDEYIDCDVMFLGNAYPHFGHFLMEHLNRAWGVVRAGKPGMKYVFIDNTGVGAKSWLFDFTKMLGIKKSDVIILNKTIRFKRVFIPWQTMNISGNWYAPEFILPFGVMRDNVPVENVYERVYVSRAKLPGRLRVYNEEKIQKIFEKNGFHVIYPETLSLAQQAAIVGNAKVLAGCAGSALHLSVFMRPGGRVIQLRRTYDVWDSGAVQYRLCMIGDLDFDVINASIEEVRSTHGGDHAPQIIGVTQYLKKFLDKNKFKYSQDDQDVDDAVMAEYRKDVCDFNATHGGSVKLKIKKKIVKITACFIPGRIWRGRYRTYMNKHFVNK